MQHQRVGFENTRRAIVRHGDMDIGFAKQFTDTGVVARQRHHAELHAGEQAGRMKQSGRLWVLLPSELAPK